jgi:preprotein translocase subunit SecG
MIYVLTVIHIVVSFFLVIVVLLQSGKAADLAGAFGGMGSQTAFGPRGSATVLSKATTIAASLFMLTSLSLAILATRGAGTSTRTVLEKQPPKPQPTAPVKPPAAPGGLPQPSVSITPEGGGPTRTIPLTLPPPPAQGKPSAPAKPAGQTPAPAEQPPAQAPATPPAKPPAQ